MNFIVENWYLIVLALVSGALLAVPMLKGAAGGLTAANAVQLINREKAVLIDVCGADEYAAGHAGGAKSVPLGELESRLPNVVKNKAIPVVMMCASGARASRAAAEMFPLFRSSSHAAAIREYYREDFALYDAAV